MAKEEGKDIKEIKWENRRGRREGMDKCRKGEFIM
jgi:hypothetical protein